MAWDLVRLKREKPVQRVLLRTETRIELIPCHFYEVLRKGKQNGNKVSFGQGPVVAYDTCAGM